MIARYQESYQLLNKSLLKENITAREVKFIYDQKNYIAEEVARFILDSNTIVEVLNNTLLED